MRKFSRILAAAAFVFAVSVATLGSTSDAEAFTFFPSWKGVSGLDLGSGR